MAEASFKDIFPELSNSVSKPLAEPGVYSGEINMDILAFSFALKKALYDDNPICSLSSCGQKIMNIDDVAIDHIEQYWMGGATVTAG